MTLLSPHFSVAEFERSTVALRQGIPNGMPPEALENARQLCTRILEPVYRRFGPLRIESGFRAALVNKLVGGASGSQHILGQATDIEAIDPDVSNFQLAWWIHDHVVGWDQLISEYWVAGYPKSGWVHVSWSPTPRRMALTKTTGQPYVVGLPTREQAEAEGP